MSSPTESAELPVPVTTTWSEKFWEGLDEGRFLLQRCAHCHVLQGYPKPLCQSCGKQEFDWVESSGRGRVYSHTTVENNPPSPFIPALPYTLVIVELEEGVRYLAGWAGSEPPSCEQPIEAVYEPRGDGVLLPRFAPAGES